MGSPLFLLRDEPQVFVAFLIAVIVGITFHEFSHAAVANLQGDQTAKSQGRLTLNPISHLDPLGSIALILAGIGWGRPVPVNPSNLRNRRFGGIMVGLAGDSGAKDYLALHGAHSVECGDLASGQDHDT